MPLLDNDKIKQSRARYTDHPNAQKPPFVLRGDTLSSGTFWHGKLLDQWANDWVRYWTNNQGNFVTTAMEDSGTLQSLTNLAHAGKVDLSRVMVLRTASNYDQPPPGRTAAENLAEENSGLYSAYIRASKTPTASAAGSSTNSPRIGIGTRTSPRTLKNHDGLSRKRNCKIMRHNSAESETSGFQPRKQPVLPLLVTLDQFVRMRSNLAFRMAEKERAFSKCCAG